MQIISANSCMFVLVSCVFVLNHAEIQYKTMFLVQNFIRKKLMTNMLLNFVGSIQVHLYPANSTEE
jgi:hypothetical protein